MLSTDDPLAQGIPMRENRNMFFWATVESNEDSALNRLSESISEEIVKKKDKKSKGVKKHKTIAGALSPTGTRN